MILYFFLFQVPANHLLTATVMSAPAALAMSKLSCPETEVSKASTDDFYKIGTEYEFSYTVKPV